MSISKKLKCIDDKNAALEHCWGELAAQDRKIAALTAERDRQYEYNVGQIVKETKLQSEIAALRKALGPFAEFIKNTDPVWSDERRIATLNYDFDKLRLGIFRAARDALAASPAPDPVLSDGNWIVEANDAGDIPRPAPDPAEAMRAKTLEECATLAQAYDPTDKTGTEVAIFIGMAIRSLKGNGEGLPPTAGC